MSISNNTRKFWLQRTEKYRENLDLATILTHWRKIDRSLDVVKKHKDILNALGVSHIDSISPRGLWHELLGECKINQQLKKMPPIPDDEFGLNCFPMDGFTKSKNGIVRLGTEDENRNVFNLPEWLDIYNEAIRLSKPCNKYSLTWLARYRDAIQKVTYFTDYWLVHRQPHEYGFYQLVFMEPHIINCMQDIYDVGMIYSHTELKTLPSLSNSKDINFNNITGNPIFTHQFINIDYLIEISNEFELDVPDEFKLPVSNYFSSSVSGNESANVPLEKYELDNQAKIRCYRGDQFELLKTIPKLINYLLYNPHGIKLMDLNKPEKIKKGLVRISGFSSEYIKHIWHIVVPPEKRTSPNESRIHLIDELEYLREFFWLGDKSHDYWGREDKLTALTDGELKLTANEAKAIIAVLSPEKHKQSGKTNEKDFYSYQKMITEIDLSWVNDTYLLNIN